MRAKLDPLGKVLIRKGVLSQELLQDVLEQQRRTMPLGSLCYILGHLDEETLARALTKQFGVPSVVLDKCIIALQILDDIPREIALEHNILPVFEDGQRLFVAAEDPHNVSQVLRQLRFVRGKVPTVHVALQVTLARAIRACYAARARGERLYVGPLANAQQMSPRGYMAVIAEAERRPNADITDAVVALPVADAAVDDVTKELDSLSYRFGEEPDDEFTNTAEHQSLSDNELLALDPTRVPGTTQEKRRPGTIDEPTAMPTTAPALRSVLDLDAGGNVEYQPQNPSGQQRVLIVDDDFATRHLLVKVLQPLGIQTATAGTGGEAVRQLQANPPDIVITDVMLPEMDGFQICQAIKQSQKYRHISVIFMSAVFSSQRVNDEIIQRYGAEGYYEKPIDTEKVKARVKELLRSSSQSTRKTSDDGFEQAIAMYKRGDIDDAIALLRTGIEVDPLSSKHHFVLANLLQTKDMLYEAIEEYEATIKLTPDYFPALTRLAYLYYKKGFSAKAAQVWERSLKCCTDDSLRQNILGFISNLRAEMDNQNL